MSLIHKALKKAGTNEQQNGSEPPIETFIGEKKGIKSQLTPRTVILLILTVLVFIFMLYKRCSHRETTFKSSPIPQVAVPAPAQGPAAQDVATPPVAAVALSPSAESALIEGKKYYDNGKYDEALSKFLEADMKGPNNPIVYNNIGLVYKKKNNFAQAENYYKRALAAKPDYAECMNNLGVLKAAAGDVLSASVYLKKAISTDATYPDAYFNLAVLNDEEGNYHDAIANYKNFLQYTESDNESLTNNVKERIEQLSQ